MKMLLLSLTLLYNKSTEKVIENTKTRKYCLVVYHTSPRGPGRVGRGTSCQPRWRSCRPCNGPCDTCLATAALRSVDSGRCALRRKKTKTRWIYPCMSHVFLHGVRTMRCDMGLCAGRRSNDQSHHDLLSYDSALRQTDHSKRGLRSFYRIYAGPTQVIYTSKYDT